MSEKFRTVQLKVFDGDDDRPSSWLEWPGLSVKEYKNVLEAIKGSLPGRGPEDRT